MIPNAPRGAADRSAGHDRLAWRVSRRCESSEACVELAALPGGGVGVRDTTDRGAAPLTFTSAQWAAFVGHAKRGEYDLPGPRPT